MKLSERNTTVITWLLRVIVGAVFIVSGISKLIDLWGFIFKIEDYLAVWKIDVPRTIVFIGGLALSTFEFTAGCILALGCYRRTVLWGLLAIMAFMTPLTLYIWIANPVEDCGCFGDLLILSNAATFWKNIVIVIALLFLTRINTKVVPLFKPSIQWIAVFTLIIYCFTIALIGYNIQPLVDFRPFPTGEPLIANDVDENGVIFIYEKDGKRAEFKAEELPDDESGWEYVDRIEPQHDGKSLAIFDPETGDDVTDEYLTDTEELLLLVIPEPARADLSSTYTINELAEVVSSRGGDMIALLAASKEGIERWQDNSMAGYPCLQADDTELKELSRGVMSMVWVQNDTVKWKRTVASIELGDVEKIVNGEKSIEDIAFDGNRYFTYLTAILTGVLLLLYAFQTLGVTFRKPIGRK